MGFEAFPLFRQFHAASLANDGDLNLAGILQFVFDLGGDVAGQGEGRFIIDLFGLDKDTQFPARLDGKSLFDARKTGGNFFEVFDPFQVSGQVLGTGSRA